MGRDPDQDAFDAACDLETEALEAVAKTRCESDADFFAKATYLIEREREAWGTELSGGAAFGLLALATELHTKGESALEALAGVPPADNWCLPDNGERIVETLLRSPIFS
jgi:hypothetical protein